MLSRYLVDIQKAEIWMFNGDLMDFTWISNRCF